MPFADATSLVSRPAALRAMADRRGHFLVRGCLPAGRVQEAREVALWAAHRQGWLRTSEDWCVRDGVALTGAGYDDPAWVSFQQEVLAHPAFRALGEADAIRRVLRGIYGASTQGGQGDICRAAFPDALTQTTPPHQDFHYTRRCASAWTVWLPLTPCPLEMGPLALVDGSHQEGLKKHTSTAHQPARVALDADTPWSSEALHPGDAVFFHCMTIHRALPNRSKDRIRFSADFRYHPQSMSP